MAQCDLGNGLACAVMHTYVAPECSEDKPDPKGRPWPPSRETTGYEAEGYWLHQDARLALDAAIAHLRNVLRSTYLTTNAEQSVEKTLNALYETRGVFETLM